MMTVLAAVMTMIAPAARIHSAHEESADVDDCKFCAPGAQPRADVTLFALSSGGARIVPQAGRGAALSDQAIYDLPTVARK